MDYKILTGTVQTKTNNSLKINNYWVKFFKVELIKDIIIGDKVEVKYKDNEKDGRTYHNGSSIRVIDEIDNPKDLTSELPKASISDTSLNTILMISKDIYLTNLNGKSLEEITKEVINCYKLIRFTV